MATETTNAPVYEIRAIDDFLHVPGERRAACLAEFATYLEMVESTTGLLDAVSDEVTAPGAIRWQSSGVFRWIDDGERNITVNVLTEPRAQHG